jgi:hypothetical protein
MAANTLQTISMIGRRAAMVLGNECNLVKQSNRSFDDEFGVKSAQIGQNFNIRRPPRPTVNVGAVINQQPIVETYTPLTFTDPYNTSYALTSQEMTFSIEDYFEKVAEPSARALASKIESVGQGLITKFFNTVGTPGTALTGGSGGTALPAVTKAQALLQKNDAPMAGADRRTLLNDPDFNAVLATSNLTYFNPGPEISKNYSTGMQGDFSNFRVFMNQLVKAHVNGTYGGSPVVATTVPANNTYPANGVNTSTLATSGWTATTTSLNVGDVFTIGSGATGVYMVNPQTKETLGTLQQFSVQVKSVDDGSGNTTLTIAPAIITYGGFQNVSQAPASGSTINVLGASGAVTQNALAFDRDAIVVAAKELDRPSTGIVFSTKDTSTNVPIRVWQMSDVQTGQEIMRFDVMVAWNTLYDQLGVRIATT